MKALKVQGISRDTLPYKAPFQPYGSWFAIGSTLVITIFKGFDTIITPFKVDTFITSYIAIPVFVILFFGYKLTYKTKFIPSELVDLTTGLQEIDDEEKRYLAEMEAKGPRTRLQRIWDSL